MCTRQTTNDRKEEPQHWTKARQLPRVVGGGGGGFPLCVCVRACVRVCVCVCARARARVFVSLFRCCCYLGFFVCLLLLFGFFFWGGWWGTEGWGGGRAGGLLNVPQPASVSQGRICSANCTHCLTETEAADQTYLIRPQYTDAGPTSLISDPITQGARHGRHWSTNS